MTGGLCKALGALSQSLTADHKHKDTQRKYCLTLFVIREISVLGGRRKKSQSFSAILVDDIHHHLDIWSGLCILILCKTLINTKPIHIDNM